MNFGIFRKYQKPLLWATVIFSVLIFATFSGLGDLERLISGDDPDALGRFVIPSTGEQVDISVTDFRLTQVALNRLPFTRGQRLEEDDVWQHLMFVEEARAAGLAVSDAELGETVQFVTQLVAQNAEGPTGYHELQVYRQFSFASPRQFEEALRDYLLALKWRNLKLRATTLPPADDVYLRWRTDNELFDFDAMVFADIPIEEIEDPGDDALRAYFDEMAEATRNARFKSPAQQDIAYAWLPLDTDLAVLPAEILAEIAEPDDNQIRSRYFQSLTEFTQEALQKELSDEERAGFATEVKIQEAASDLTAAINELPDEERTKERFAELSEAYGFAYADPEGLLEPEAIDALEGMTESAHTFMTRTTPGNATAVTPFRNATSAAVAFVEERIDEKPLAFEEAREQILEAWKTEQADRYATEFREELTARTKALPEVAEVIESILEVARTTVEQRIAESTEELTDEQKENMRTAAIDAEQFTIDARVTQDEHKVWDEVVAEFLDKPGVERRRFDDVSKGYANNPDEADEEGGFDRWLKMNRALTSLGIDGISTRLRHQPSSSSVVVRVADRSFPDKGAMFSDAEGMTLARQTMLGQSRESAAAAFDIEQMKSDYKLEVIDRDEGGQG